MRSVVNKQERNLANDESLAANEPDIREQLRVLEQHQGNDNQRLDEVNSGIADIQARHERALLQFLNLEQKRESQYRELERAHLLSVNARLPQHSDSARYILAQLLTDADCLLCGNNVPSAMESMKSRIRGLECIVCGSDLSPVGDQILTDSADERISSREEDLQATDAELEAARNILQESEGERARAITEVQVLQTAIAERSARLEMLLKRLPPEEGRLHERRREFASLRAQVEALRYDLDEKHMSFEQTITAANTTVEKQAGEVQTSFDDFAHRFLLEDCRLLWSPQRARLGQSGGRFYFPAFELELGGSDFNGTFRRNGPDFVSESQREFIDLSFRMALAKVATKRHVSSLVMDAPESSLDAVFVDRAAGVLGTFGRSEEGNRLLVTSNIVEGNLIPALLKKAADKGDRANRVVDLLALATSTVAVRRHRDEYHAARDRLLGEADALE